MVTEATWERRSELLMERFEMNLVRFRKFLRQFLKNRLAFSGLVIILLFIVMALGAGLLVGPYPSPLGSTSPMQSPSGGHPMGTDVYGRDILKLLIYGAQVSLLIGLVSSFVAMVLGTFLGVASGYYGGVTDHVLSRVTDFFLVIPWLPFVIVVVALLGQSLATIITAIAIVSWPTTTRVIRSQVLSVKQRGFIERARAVGAGDRFIMRRHILPNVMPLVWAEAVLTISSAVFTEAFLSFFGLGWIGPGSIESWGQMVNEAYTASALPRGMWWYFAPPGLFITFLVLGFAMLGYGIEEILNPALKRRG